MSDLEELKPIEEINGITAEKTKEEPPSAPLTVPEPPKPASEKSSSLASVPTPPQAAPTPPIEPGKKAVIKRAGGEGNWVKYLISAMVVLLIGAGVFYYFFYRVTFDINPSPIADKILLNNNEVKPGTYRVKPGVHTLDIEKAGYVSYISAKKYSFGEHVVLNFTFQAQKSPIVSIPGAKLGSISSEGKYLFFLNANSNIAVLDLTNKDGQASQLSSTPYQTAKILKVSKDKSFAILLDNEAIKVVNFNRSDLINQNETKLPPLASGIHSLTWNNSESQYFPQANSKILYDLQSSSSWDIFLANLSHTQADVIMRVEKNNFPNLSMDWGNNPNKVLITGGEVGILDISKRDYKKISSDKQFSWGKWSPDGSKAVVTDTEGGVWLYQTSDSAFTLLPFKSQAGLVDFVDTSNIAAVGNGRPIKYNFDTKQEVNYAEVKGLSECSTFIAKEDVFYFETVDGIFSGKFEASGY